jgi:hypothetical protein
MDKTKLGTSSEANTIIFWLVRQWLKTEQQT